MLKTVSQKFFRAALILFLFFVFFGNTARFGEASNPVEVIIHFDKGSYSINNEGTRLIEELARNFSQWQIQSILVEGFSDLTKPSSSRSYSDNQTLSKLRADSVAHMLQDLTGLQESLFKITGYGTEQSAFPNDTAEGRAANRRVKVTIIRMGDTVVNSEDLPSEELITASFNDVPIAEAFEMLSRKERINILLEKGVEGKINANLYNMSLNEAIHALAESAGYSVDRQHRGYLIMAEDKIQEEKTIIRTYKVQYSDPEEVKDILLEHKSEAGKITVLKDRDMLVIEDISESIERMQAILKEIDKQPKQILIEAKILEITLDDTETFGLDWSRLLNIGNGTGSIGMQGFASDSATGFVAKLTDADKISMVLNVLSEKGRVHTLSTPKLLALENQEASVIIGDRQGYKVTTTINQVTNESIEFLESGIILKVTPSVDEQGRILMNIHPEVSTGAIAGDIPSQTTTEVTTDLLAENGQPIFIGGLIKKISDRSRDGLPVLGDIPLLGLLFSSTKDIITSKETVVLITPYIMGQDGDEKFHQEAVTQINRTESNLDDTIPEPIKSNTGFIFKSRLKEGK